MSSKSNDTEAQRRVELSCEDCGAVYRLVVTQLPEAGDIPAIFCPYCKARVEIIADQ